MEQKETESLIFHSKIHQKYCPSKDRLIQNPESKIQNPMSFQTNAPVRKIKVCYWAIAELPGLSHDELLLLENAGIISTQDLLKLTRTPQERVEIAQKLQIHLQHVSKWIALSDLARVQSVGTQYCGLILHAGITNCIYLANAPVSSLHKQVMRLYVSMMQRRDLCPGIDLVQQWTQQAKMISNLH